MDSKLPAVCDGHGRPLIRVLSEGLLSDYKGAGDRATTQTGFVLRGGDATLTRQGVVPVTGGPDVQLPEEEFSIDLRSE